MQALFAALRHTSETPLQCEVVKEAPDDSTVGSFSRFEPALSQQMLEQRVNLHFPKTGFAPLCGGQLSYLHCFIAKELTVFLLRAKR